MLIQNFMYENVYILPDKHPHHLILETMIKLMMPM